MIWYKNYQQIDVMRYNRMLMCCLVSYQGKIWLILIDLIDRNVLRQFKDFFVIKLGMMIINISV